jgi:hypothetical protein
VDRGAYWESAHRIGDLVRVTKKANIDFNHQEIKIGDLGVVTKSPAAGSGVLFIEIYLLRTGNVRLCTANEIDIISNIED